ncbi:MAG TPA: acetate--CoA ligase [Sediminibacterium sp.]|jgi:acetyl-CoA synthetase|uniref:acetate--CoA ligase n=2 Tax=Sediminibacterium sp. TaxID=1917865 RepID=UPI0008B8327D|nr:acetate--CoA ligase [Sediminibacterium sp.]OHC86397.1 MAG: acetate--CoA ligase [Sphingobacteriia bacterium RIFOXYC2_FULL_35_18]OHC89910.1 MAG: acetate--CoA ligase [Sphingobacteriia bacterium RIFOXYD2_FULL_35_12]OYZ51943.1 MAG: acetate--CoA ligase [Sphingobacteriia bacterium 24-36-13]OZA65133.1 MAG: acetate--CoA ligase [Sphingobacteriia bacterium 39-36-14]MBT9484128.1 acetate--CoA ligase [Sediminibacterium sp.]
MSYPYQINSFEEYQKVYKESVENPEAFWASVAENFVWKKKWDKVLDWNFTEPKNEWFKGGKLNITENCLDRHLAERGNVPAIIWESNDPNEKQRILTYSILHKRVCQFAQVLINNGVQKGDRVCVYMGMIPELAIAILACARIGAIHSVIFGGFSAQSIADRLYDAQSEFIITCDGAFRGGKDIPLKSVIDDALIGNRTVRKVIVYTRTRTPISMIKGRDVWWEDEMRHVEEMGIREIDAVEMDAEDPLFILYTSGSTGKPKGVVHACAGYMVYTNYTFVNIFNYQPGQIHFCTADIGWITGHSYIVYGPLSAGATSLMFEGVPTWPDAGRFWEIVDKYKVNILYTAPTAIRSLMSYGLGPLQGKDLSSLKVLGTVGEPINEEAWHWYNENVGKKKCPIIDTWWQTETGGCLITNLAGITPSKPGWATLPMPGIQPILVDEKGVEITEAEDGVFKGNLCIKFPWPSLLRTTYGDHERCRTNYFATYENLYFTGDGALKDENGFYRITGRVDDVLNVSGHRIGTAEVENAINMHAGVIESAVVGYPHDVKGQGIYAYVIYSNTHGDEELTRKDILQTVTRMIGPIAKPDKIQFVNGLPKTRSGKIMRRILRKIAEGETENLGDTSTLLDPGVVEEIKNGHI